MEAVEAVVSEAEAVEAPVALHRESARGNELAPP